MEPPAGGPPGNVGLLRERSRSRNRDVLALAVPPCDALLARVQVALGATFLLQEWRGATGG